MASPRIPTSSQARELQLQGARAVAWLREMGWKFDADLPPQIFADLVRCDPFSIGRIWHMPGTATLMDAEHWHDSVLIAVFAIDGEQTAISGDQVTVLHAGEWLVQRLNEPLTITATVPVARLVVVTDWRDHWLLPDQLISGTPHREYAAVFIQAANAALNAQTLPGDEPFHRLKSGLEQLFASLLVAATPARADSSTGKPGARGLRVRALELMRQHSADLAFDINALCRLLDVAPATLYRSFADTGTTPARALRGIRVENARAALARASALTQAERTAIARQSGFGSLRSLQRALITDLSRTPVLDE